MLGSTQVVQQLQVVSQAELAELVHVQPVAIFDANGNPLDFTGNPVAATTTVAGIVKKMPAQVDSVAADVATLKTDFNALLAKLRTAGILT